MCTVTHPSLFLMRCSSFQRRGETAQNTPFASLKTGFWVKKNLVLLKTRKDMAMLGLVHRAVLRKGPPQFWEFFDAAADTTRRTRLGERRRSRQLEDTRKGRFLEVLRRSALGLAAVYNLLPAKVVQTETVSDFQGNLQELLKERAASGCENWPETFSPRIPLWKHPLL